MSIAAKVGDVFYIPLDDSSFGLGVVAGKWKSELYLVVFKERFQGDAHTIDINIHDLTPAIASSSLDAKIWHGHWPIVKRGVDVSALVQPIYKVEEPVGYVAESFDRKYRRAISSVVADRLSYRKGVAPIRLENALKAHHGLCQWDMVFDELDYERAVNSNRVMSDVA